MSSELKYSTKEMKFIILKRKLNKYIYTYTRLKELTKYFEGMATHFCKGNIILHNTFYFDPKYT